MLLLGFFGDYKLGQLFMISNTNFFTSRLVVGINVKVV